MKRKNVEKKGNDLSNLPKIFVIISLILTGLIIMPSNVNSENIAILSVAVKDQNNNNISNALVYCVNVHSGVIKELFWHRNFNHFCNYVVSGTYQIFASAEGFISPAEPQLIYRLTRENDFNILTIILNKIDNNGKARFHVVNLGIDNASIDNAVVHLFGPDRVYLNGTTDINGNVTISCPLGDFHMLVSAENMLTLSHKISINGTENFTIGLSMEPLSDEGSFRIIGDVMNGTNPISNASIHIWDNAYRHLVPQKISENGSLSIPLYSSIFNVLIEANGYESLFIPNIDLSQGSNFFKPSNGVFELKEIQKISSKVTEIDLSVYQGIKNPQIKTVWTLDANSRIFGFDNEFGNPRMQTSGPFYTMDWLTVDASEANAIKEKLKSYGPDRIITSDFLRINGEHYLAVGECELTIDRFEGNVLDEVNPIVQYTQGYDGEPNFKIGDNLRIDVLEIQRGEFIILKVPNEYEFFGNYGKMSEFPYNGSSSMILLKEPVNLTAKLKRAYEAEITLKEEDNFYKVENKKYIVKVDENITLIANGSFDPIGSSVEYYWSLPKDNLLLNGSEVGINDSFWDIIVKVFEDKQITFKFKHDYSYYNITLFARDYLDRRLILDWIELSPDSQPPYIDSFTINDSEGNVFIGPPFVLKEDKVYQLNALHAMDRGIITDYIWSISDGNEPIYGRVIKHQFFDPGDYNISLKLIDAVGNEFSLENKTIHVKDLTKPEPVIKLPLNRSIGEKVILDGSQSYDHRTTGNLFDALTEYTWQMRRKDSEKRRTIGTGKILEYYFQEPGYFVINLTVTDSNSNKGWTERSILIDGPDLVIETITFLDPEINKLMEGDRAKVSVKINNSGVAGTLKGYTWFIEVYIDQKMIKNVVTNQTVNSQGTIYVNFTINLKVIGNHRLKIRIDSTNEILESNENNNEFTTIITVKEKSNPWVLFLIVIFMIILIFALIIAFFIIIVRKKDKGPEVQLEKRNAEERPLEDPESIEPGLKLHIED